MKAQNWTLVIFFIIFFSMSFFIVFSDSGITGFASKNPDGSFKLKITSECSAEPDLYAVWKINNRNEFNISYDWILLNSNQNGTNIALSDKTYFNTTIINGSNIVEIYVNNSLEDFKEYNPDNCTLPELCFENWTCSNWSGCINSSQGRECNDINSCNTTIEIPELIQNCTGLVQNDTNQTSNETVEEEPIEPVSVLVAAPAGGGGGGGGSSSDLNIVYLNKTEETGEIEQPVEKSVIETISEEPEELQESTGFIQLMGNAIKIPLEGVNWENNPGLIVLLTIILLSGAVSAAWKLSR